MITYAMDHKQIVIQTFNTTVIIIHFVIIPAKVIVAQTQIQEDAADIEDNLVSILKAYNTKNVL
ncbi:hypothetical protein [Veillonella parvula]|uniref:hypothetical protein n=1 Tax=Veillonella parvula TaxID=29466 RepID=UPI0026EE8DC2|nr:hypothetical protein [Veillonella parvula]